MSDETPKVVEVMLKRDYRFMYENFVIVTQHATYLLMEKDNDAVWVLYFDAAKLKYGSPNDEARHGHPLCKYGLGNYGFFEVHHSPWIREQMIANRVHYKHDDSMFDGYRHFIACFKDVMLEITCRSYVERTMTVSEINDILQKQLKSLEDY